MKQTFVPLAKKSITLILTCALVASLLCIGGSFTLPFAHATETGDTQDTQVQGTTTDETDGEGTTGQNTTTTPGTDGGGTTPPASGEGEGSSGASTAGEDTTVSKDDTDSTADSDPEPTTEELSELFILAGDNITTLDTSTGGSSLIGRGTSEDPLQIHTGQQLKDFAECFNAGTLPAGVSDTAPHLVLMNDIDISSFANWEPIGSYKNNTVNKPFQGSFMSSKGDSFTIKGLSIDASPTTTNSSFGLFGYVKGGSDVKACIENIRVEATQVNVTLSGTSSDLYVGVLVGHLDYDCVLNHCSASGDVKVQGGADVYAGGLAGRVLSAVSNSSATGSASSSGGSSSSVGGLAGYAEALVSYCNATGSVSSLGGSVNKVGGLVGDTPVNVTSSYATGSATALDGTSGNYAGGLVGNAYGGAISNSHATGAASASGGSYAYAGGLAGNSIYISGSYATGSAIASDGSRNYAGGLVGQASYITTSYATGSATATDGSDNYAGGLGGEVASIATSYATGSVSASGESRNYAGGLAGSASQITESIALGQQVSASGGTHAAGRITTSTPGIFDNYAWEGMLVDGSPIADTVVEQKQGTPAPYAMLTGRETDPPESNLWTETLASFNTIPWKYDSEREAAPYALPVLTTVSNATAQNTNLPFWIQDTNNDPDEYYIYTTEDLATFRDMVNAGNDFSGKTVYLMNNIDISCYPNWEPIGIRTGVIEKLFSGVFRSYAKDSSTPSIFTISGLSIEADDRDIDKNICYGLFGALSGTAELRNINVEAQQVQVSSSFRSQILSVGVLVGYVKSGEGTIDTCSASGNVRVSGGTLNRVGGLAGLCFTAMSNCYALGSVSCFDYSNEACVGGLVGRSQKEISHSFATGSVTASSGFGDNRTGGLAGEAGPISSCYATGSVVGSSDNGTSRVGGLAGSVTKISKCYALGSVTASSPKSLANAGGLAAVAPTIETSIALNQSVSGSSYGSSSAGRIVASGFTVSACYAWEGMNVTGSGGMDGISAGYKTLVGQGQSPSPTNLWETLKFSTGSWKYDNSNRTQDPYAIPILTGIPNGSQNENLPFWIRDTTTNNYYISTPQELAAFRDMVNAGNTFDGKTVYLMNDIDLSCYPNWEPIGIYHGGSTDLTFKGVFTSYSKPSEEPATFSIKNLTLNITGSYSASNTNFGLFSSVQKGSKTSIERIRVEDAQIHISNIGKSYINVGVLAGSVDKDCSIVSCSASGTVYVSGEAVSAGGLIGTGVPEISDSYASSSVTVFGVGSYSSNAGGLLGGGGSTISDSYATGAVYISNANIGCVGGLVGSSFGTITNCYATGAVTASNGSSQNNLGGLVGSASSGKITASYATGTVRIRESSSSPTNYAGGLVGRSHDTVISDTYALGPVSIAGNSANYAGGLVGMSGNDISGAYACGTVGATGAGENFAGGVVGYADGASFHSFDLKNTVALNQKITATGGSSNDVGRIVGELSEVALSNNYAWEGTLVEVGNGAPITIETNDSNYGQAQLHGAHVSSSNALNAVWWALEAAPAEPSGPAFDFTETGAWEATDSYLPLLKNPKAAPWRPLWLITFPEENCTLELATEDETTFLKSDGITETVIITATGTYIDAVPNALVWTCKEDPDGEEVTILDSTNTGATVKVDLSAVGTYTIQATLRDWPDISDTLTIYVKDDLGIVGTASISGSGVFDSTLTASFDITDTSKPAPQEFSYAWYADGELIPGASGSTLSLSDENLIGKSIQVRITASNYYNYAESTGITVVKTPYSGEVLDPQLAEVSSASVTLVECTDYEYQLLPAGTPATGLLSTGWQDSPHFTPLDSNKSYDIYQRVKETRTVTASDHKGPLNVRTPLEFTWHSGLSSYTKQSNASFGLTVNYELDLLDSVLVDGQAVTDIKTTSGSTIIIFGNAYLDGLSVGTHTLKVTYTDGAFIDTSFEVKAASAPTPSPQNPGGGTTPKTGDTILPILALVGALIVVAVGIFVARRIITKRDKKQ